MTGEGDSVSASPQGAAGPIGMRFASLVALAAVCALVAAALALDIRGRNARWDAPERGTVVIVGTARESMDAWERAGVRNAVLVSASRDLSFAPLTFGSDVTAPSAYPVEPLVLKDAYASRADRENYLWVASQTGMFRTVHHVLPRAELDRRVAQGREQGFPGIAPDGASIRPNNDGYVRHVAADVPTVNEPIVLNVDASYFESGDAGALAAEIERSGLDYRLLTLDRCVDDTATTDAARARLDEFAALMGAAR